MDLLRSIFKGDKVIWIIFLFLCLISIVEVFSAASTLTYKSGDHWGPITQHSIILMVGAVVVVFMHNIPYKWFQVFPVFLLPLSVVLLGLVMMMERINGAARWMTFMGIQFQPSEVAKMAVIIVTAFILSKGQDEDGASPKAFKRIMIITGVVCLLIAPENLSTAALLFGVVFLMMFIGRVAIKKLLILAGALAGVAIIGVAFLVLTKNSDLPFLHRFDTWRARIEKFTDDTEVPAAKFDIDKDAQIAHARIAVATSNVVGRGPGNSVQRDFLSQAFSDFIFAIIVEELGLIGGAFTTSSAFKISSSVCCPSSQEMSYLSSISLYLLLMADMSDTNVSNPFTLASTAAPAPLSPAPNTTILLMFSLVTGYQLRATSSGWSW